MSLRLIIALIPREIITLVLVSSAAAATEPEVCIAAGRSPATISCSCGESNNVCLISLVNSKYTILFI